MCNPSHFPMKKSAPPVAAEDVPPTRTKTRQQQQQQDETTRARQDHKTKRPQHPIPNSNLVGFRCSFFSASNFSVHPTSMCREERSNCGVICISDHVELDHETRNGTSNFSPFVILHSKRIVCTQTQYEREQKMKMQSSVRKTG